MLPTRMILSLLIFIAAICGCSQPLHIQSTGHRHYSIQGSGPVDTSLVNMLKPYKAGVDTQMKVVIGATDVPLSKAQPESLLGNLVADAQLQSAKQFDHKVVASIANYGGMRLSYLPPGPITRGDMFQLMPFDNKIVIVEVPGETLKILCDHMAKAKGWPVSGISYTITDGKATDVLINNHPINEHIIYKLALSDYIATGGDRCDFLTDLPRKYTKVLVRDALIDYVIAATKSDNIIHPVLENRVKYAK